MSGTTQDTITLDMAEDAFLGDAQFSVSVNGQEIASSDTVTASQSDGVAQRFTYHGDYGSGPISVTVTFLNDAWASPAQDRNLYVDGVTINGNAPASATATTDGTTQDVTTPVELPTTGDSVTFSIPCYLRGTRIAVPGGTRPVETLREGDLVLTASDEARPIVWIGNRRCDISTTADPARARPIRVKADAVAPGVPERDLLVSPEHMVMLDGVLIPAQALVNSTTVTVAEDITAPHYFHVELASHDVLLAEGMPAESWLDTGNRGMFANAPAGTTPAEPATTPSSLACAPVVEHGPALEQARAALARRASEMGTPVGTVRIPLDAPGTYRVELRPGVKALRLATQAAMHAGDQRRLGATVLGIAFDGHDLDLADARLARGFHDIEHHGVHTLRWTDGDALIALGAELPAAITIRVGSIAQPIA